MALRMKSLTNSELSVFASQMAMILKAGIPPLEGISIMNEEQTNRNDRNVLTQMEKILSDTGSFSEAVKQIGVFPDYFVRMTHIGETTGKLDDVMESISVHFNREAQIATSVRQAVTYPFVMVSMMIVVVLMLVMKVLPAFNDAFVQLGYELTGFSKLALDFGYFLNKYSIYLLGIFAVVLVLFFFFSTTRVGQRTFVKFIRTFGWGKKISHIAAACRISSGMSIILSSGLNIENSVELTTGLVEDPVYRRRMRKVAQDLDDGVQFDKAMKNASIFEGVFSQMTTVGYKTGTMDEIMNQISTSYEEELDYQLGRIIAILEPTLVIILSAIVGAVLLSVMLPLLGVLASF